MSQSWPVGSHRNGAGSASKEDIDQLEKRISSELRIFFCKRRFLFMKTAHTSILETQLPFQGPAVNIS